jgi:hypothetical protein
MRIKMQFMTSLLAVLIVFSAAQFATGQELKFDPNDPAVKKGHEIIAAINALPVVEKVYVEAELRIYDKQDNVLYTKQFRSAQFFKDYQDSDNRLQRAISYFYAPADDKGNGAMVFEHPDSDDDEQYLYLRQTRKARRIIGSSKKDDYFGSDFSAGDVTRRRIQDYNFRYLGEDTIDFRGKKLNVVKLESQFKSPQKREDWGEGKSIVWIHPDSGLAFKAERYDTQLQLTKVQTLLAFTKTKNKDGKDVYLVAASDMKTLNRGTHSTFQITARKYEGDAGFSTDIYSTDSFTKQWW